MGQRPPDGFAQVGLVDPELAHRPPHAHEGAHELGGGVDPEANPDPASPLLCHGGQPVDLVQGLHVDREDTLIDGPPELIVGLRGPGEHDVFRGEPRGPHHYQLAGRGYLGTGEPLPGNQLAYSQAGVGLDGVQDLHPLT